MSYDLFVLVDLTASIYAINDALVSKNIVSKQFLEARKRHYEKALKDGLLLLAKMQTGKMTQEEFHKQSEDLKRVLVWDPDIKDLDQFVAVMEKNDA